jgi:hypothetical protein
VLSFGVVCGFFHCMFTFFNEMIHSSPACSRKKNLCLECYLRLSIVLQPEKKDMVGLQEQVGVLI